MRVLAFVTVLAFDSVVIYFGLKLARQNYQDYRRTGVSWYSGVKLEGRYAWIGATASIASASAITAGLLFSLLVFAVKLLR